MIGAVLLMFAIVFWPVTLAIIIIIIILAIWLFRPVKSTTSASSKPNYNDYSNYNYTYSDKAGWRNTERNSSWSSAWSRMNDGKRKTIFTKNNIKGQKANMSRHGETMRRPGMSMRRLFASRVNTTRREKKKGTNNSGRHSGKNTRTQRKENQTRRHLMTSYIQRRRNIRTKTLRMSGESMNQKMMTVIL